MKINKLNYKYAGLWVRICASVWDMIYLSPLMVVNYTIYFSLNNSRAQIIIYLVFGAIFALYDILFLSSAKQATLGMEKKGIKIIDKYGNKISIIRSSFRYMMFAIIPMLSNPHKDMYIYLFFLLQLLILFHPKKQAYYDIICGTYAVYNDKM